MDPLPDYRVGAEVDVRLESGFGPWLQGVISYIQLPDGKYNSQKLTGYHINLNNGQGIRVVSFGTEGTNIRPFLKFSLDQAQTRMNYLLSHMSNSDRYELFSWLRGAYCIYCGQETSTKVCHCDDDE